MQLEIINFMYSFFKENQSTMIVSIAAYIAKAGLDSIVVPRAMADAFNALSVTDDNYKEFRSSLIQLVIVWIIVKILYIISNNFRKQIEPLITEFIINKLVNAVFIKYELANELSNVSILINKIHLIKKNLQELFFLTFTIFIPKILVMFIILFNLYILNRNIGLFIIASLILQMVLVYYTHTYCIDSSFDEVKNQDKMYNYLEDIFSNINIIQSTFNGYDIELKKISDISCEVSKKEEKTLSCVHNQQNLLFGINLLMYFIILLIIYNLYTNSKMTSREVVTIILCVNGMFENIYDFSIYIPELITRLGVLKSNEDFLKELMSYFEDSNLKGDDVTLKSNFIIFKDVGFTYDTHVILDEFNYTIPSNKIIGLSGPSGSGKSTFVKMIFGIEVPTSGEIYVGNIPVSKKSCVKLRKYINYMNQNSHSLFDISIFKNLVYGYDETIKKEDIIAIMDKFNFYDIFKTLDEKAEKYSFLDKPAGKNGGNLSGGQKAIIHLIRLDFNKASKIIILDEVTAALDNNTRNAVIEYIKYLNSREKTILIISHDIYFDTLYDIHLKFSHNNNPAIIIQKK